MTQTIELGSKIKIEVDPAPAGMPLFVSITDERGHRSDYWVERFPSDWGIAVQFRKVWCGRAKDFDHRTYEINLDTVSWLHECDCTGHCRHGKCRHVDCAIALHDAGLLVLPSAAAPRQIPPATAERSELTYGPEFSEDEVYQAMVGTETADGYVIDGQLFDNP